MPELRWTLLILGALFIGGLALWEWRRQRHARGEQIAPRDSERVQPTFDPAFDHDEPRAPELGRGESRTFREPTLTFPEMTDRAPVAAPRVIEVDDPTLTGLRVDSATAIDEFSSNAMPEMSARDEPLVPELAAAADEWQEQTPVITGNEEPGMNTAEGEPDVDDPDEHFSASDGEVAVAQEEAPVAQPASAVLSGIGVEDTEPLVEWPDEDVRKIIAVRLVSAPGERFQGRIVRMALAAEGFRLGKFDIFHKPGPDARAVLSAASLTKPGTFSLPTMDAQRFGGLSLFAVLPGPLSPVATFDELMLTARSLNDRLRGALQDERGEPLTPMRSATLREGLAASATAAAPVVGPQA